MDYVILNFPFFFIWYKIENDIPDSMVAYLRASVVVSIGFVVTVSVDERLVVVV